MFVFPIHVRVILVSANSLAEYGSIPYTCEGDPLIIQGIAHLGMVFPTHVRVILRLKELYYDFEGIPHTCEVIPCIWL